MSHFDLRRTNSHQSIGMNRSVLIAYVSERNTLFRMESPMTAVLEAPIDQVDEVPEAPKPYRWRWLAYSAVLASAVMDLLDSTIVGVAAPAIQHDLGGSYASLQWMAAGYTMALAVM